MPPQQPNTAVLLFIRSGHEEARVKNFGAHLHHHSRCKIARLLNANARKVAASAGVPVVVLTGAQQRGSTFGERFANAIESTFQLGYENVVAIGNDCLSLSQSLLKKAIQRLLINDFVIGPSKDGGVYLLGLKARCFNKNKFEHLPWQTGNLLESLLRHTGGHSINCLPPAIDADDEASLIQALQNIQQGSALKKVLLNILRHTAEDFPLAGQFLAPVFPAYQFHLRAPPQLR